MSPVNAIYFGVKGHATHKQVCVGLQKEHNIDNNSWVPCVTSVWPIQLIAGFSVHGVYCLIAKLIYNT